MANFSDDFDEHPGLGYMVLENKLLEFQRVNRSHWGRLFFYDSSSYTVFSVLHWQWKIKGPEATHLIHSIFSTEKKPRLFFP